HRAFGIAGAAPVQAIARAREPKRIAAPALAGRHHVDMGIECEGRTGPVVDQADRIAPAGHDLGRIGPKTHRGHLALDPAPRRVLAAGWILRIHLDQPFEPADDPRQVEVSLQHDGFRGGIRSIYRMQPDTPQEPPSRDTGLHRKGRLFGTRVLDLCSCRSRTSAPRYPVLPRRTRLFASGGSIMRIVALCAAALALWLGLAAGLSAQPAPPKDLVSPGKITYGVAATFAPFEYVQDGKVVGFDIE